MYRQSDNNLLSSDTASSCPLNMVNVGPLAAEIDPVVWGTPANFNWVSRLGSVTARHCRCGRQPNFAALNTGRHLYSAGRPSRWALANISSSFCITFTLYILCTVNTAHLIVLARCNRWPHVVNSHISISQLLSLWRHSHYDVSWRSQTPFSLWRHLLLSWPRT